MISPLSGSHSSCWCRCNRHWLQAARTRVDCWQCFLLELPKKLEQNKWLVMYYEQISESILEPQPTSSEICLSTYFDLVLRPPLGLFQAGRSAGRLAAPREIAGGGSWGSSGWAAGASSWSGGGVGRCGHPAGVRWWRVHALSEVSSLFFASIAFSTHAVASARCTHTGGENGFKTLHCILISKDPTILEFCDLILLGYCTLSLSLCVAMLDGVCKIPRLVLIMRPVL